jgi:hypothetical protein
VYIHTCERSTKQRLTIYSTLAVTGNIPYTCFIENTVTNTYILKLNFLENFYIRIYKFNYISLLHILRFHLSRFFVADNVIYLMLPSVYFVTV